MKFKTMIIMLLCATFMQAQVLSDGLQVVNDLGNYPMQDVLKPPYLGTIIDPSFGTAIRRISNAGQGGVIKPMYSTIQAWNADESRIILYERGGRHQLLDGFSYQFIRYLDDTDPDDIEQLFWDFNDPQILYYLESGSDDFIRYNVETMNKEVLVNLDDITTNCDGSISMGNGVQMMSWDSDVISFRCNNDRAYSYRISSEELTEFNLLDDTVRYVAPMPAPSGDLFHHCTSIYDAAGNFHVGLNESVPEHSCLGKLANGADAHFAVVFDATPNGECTGNLVAHDITTGECFPLISQSQGYEYSQSGTHISALAHKNTQGGWVVASMMGYDQDGQSLLDQELILARVDEQGNVTVCRIGHHRSDEDEATFGYPGNNYWGEPHASISPTGTRVIFASDWSGVEDGESIDTYVVELPTYQPPSGTIVPVELLDFTAKKNNRKVHLNWSTATETNNAHFTVEHSAGNMSFESIGRVTGNGTTDTPHDYQFIDHSPEYGVNYYRLKQVDFDGKTEYSKVISILIQKNDNEPFIQPNPVKDIAKIILNSVNEEPVTFTLTDAYGRVAATRTFSLQKGINTLEWNVSELVPAMYFLTGNDAVHSAVKFVKR